VELSKLINTIKTEPASIDFSDVIETIEANYTFTETAFTNGEQSNKAGENNGSCKIFAFAKLQNLSEQETLTCFGQYYLDVLNTPNDTDHQNIRQFMQKGWNGIAFEGEALQSQ